MSEVSETEICFCFFCPRVICCRVWIDAGSRWEVCCGSGCDFYLPAMGANRSCPARKHCLNELEGRLTVTVDVCGECEAAIGETESIVQRQQSLFVQALRLMKQARPLRPPTVFRGSTLRATTCVSCGQIHGCTGQGDLLCRPAPGLSCQYLGDDGRCTKLLIESGQIQDERESWGLCPDCLGKPDELAKFVSRFAPPAPVSK